MAQPSPHSPIAVLTEVRALIEDSAHWTQQANARDVDGRVVDPTGENANCWCLAGALDRVEGGYWPTQTAAECLLNSLIDGSRWSSFIEWQDAPHRKHAEVLKLLDRAIAKATKG